MLKVVTENSNFDQALKMSQRIINQSKKKGQLQVFQQEINKKIEIGTLVELSDSELKQIIKGYRVVIADLIQLL